MISLRKITESSSHLRGGMHIATSKEEEPQPLGYAPWDWNSVRRVLLIRLRSIGDTVLATPSLFALKRFLRHADVDILLEDWVAPLLAGFQHVDNIITIQRGNTPARARVARKLRQSRYDIVYNLHGGTTATLLTRASGARHRVGYSEYQYNRLHNHLAPPASSLWGQDKTHSVEQQLALLGWTGVPVTDRPRTHLAVTAEASDSISKRFHKVGLNEQRPFALLHPTAAFDTKQWAPEKFAEVISFLAGRDLPVVAIAAHQEQDTVVALTKSSSVPVIAFTDLSLPEVTALASRARLFVGNDSGIAHIAAAMAVPSVVIFGSSNVAHWRPWSKAPAEVVREEMECQPCHGYFCEKFDVPECIKRVPVERVVAAVERVLNVAT